MKAIVSIIGAINIFFAGSLATKWYYQYHFPIPGMKRFDTRPTVCAVGILVFIGLFMMIIAIKIKSES